MSITTDKYTFRRLNTNDPVLNTSTSSQLVIAETTLFTDTRKLSEFKDQTFGGYNKSRAAGALEKAILEDKLDASIHWAFQLLLSGVVNSIWERLLQFASKNINIYNPKLVEFILNRTKQWNKLVVNPKYKGEGILNARNNPTIRLLLVEFVTILTLSKKRKLNPMHKIKKNEFIIDVFKSKLEAKNNNLTTDLFQDGDPSEIRIAANEFAHHLYHSNSSRALYWLSWILEWEKINSKKYGKYECAVRSISGIDSKYNKDVIWLIWMIIKKIKQLKSGLGFGENSKQIDILWELYIFNFTGKVKKQGFLIWSILYLTETIDWAIPLVDRPSMLFSNLLGYDRILVNLKSQQVNNVVVNNELMNVVVENNYLMPENYRRYEEDAKRQEMLKIRQEREQLAKQKKINVETLNKLEKLSSIDKYLNS